MPVGTLAPQRLDGSAGRYAVAEGDHSEVERRLDSIHNTTDSRNLNLEQVERRGLEGHGADEDR
jgi:hypothetical protein